MHCVHLGLNSLKLSNLESVAWNPGLSSTSLYRWSESYDLKKHNWKCCSWTARFAFSLYFQYCVLQSLVSIISEDNLPTPQASQVSHRQEADTLLQRYRGLQKAAKQPLEVEQTKCQLVCTSMWCKHTVKYYICPLLHTTVVLIQIDVCLMELTPTKLCWKRASQLVKVGGFLDHEDWKATKKRCADALDLHGNPDNLVLVVKGATVDQSAFVSLGSFMSSFTAQQRAHFFFGIGIKVIKICI